MADSLPTQLRAGALWLAPGTPPPDELAQTYRQPRLGRCYELTALWTAAHVSLLPPRLLERLQITVLHGSIEGFGNPRIGHAWIELNLGGPIGWQAHDPVVPCTGPFEVWRTFARARVARSYDIAEFAQHLTEAEHTGPWHDRPFGLADCGHGLDPCTLGCEEDD